MIEKVTKRSRTPDNTAQAFSRLDVLWYYSRIVALSGHVLTEQYNVVQLQNVLERCGSKSVSCLLFSPDDFSCRMDAWGEKRGSGAGCYGKFLFRLKKDPNAGNYSTDV